MALQLNGPGIILLLRPVTTTAQKCQSPKEICHIEVTLGGPLFRPSARAALDAPGRAPSFLPAPAAPTADSSAWSRGAQSVHAQTSHGADDGIHVQTVGLRARKCAGLPERLDAKRHDP